MWPAASLTSLDAIRNFYNVTPEVWQAFVDSAGDPADDLKSMASLPPALLATCVTAARLPSGSPLTTVQASQVGLVFRAARRNLFVQSGGDPKQWIDPNPWETTSSTSPPTSPTATSSHTMERKMKFVNVLDQSDESEFNIIDDRIHAKLMGTFVTLTGGLPAPDEEPTREQLSALHRKVYVLNQPPYADFAVFTPHNKRFLKAMKYRTFVPTMEGGYMAKEVPGPASYSQWLGSFRVWRASMLMLEILDLALIQRYELLVENMVKQLPGCWHLIVSAEDQARSDQLARLQMQAMMNHAVGDVVPRGWVETRPCWGPIFKLLIEDHQFWQEHVHAPAMSWLAYGRHGQPKTPSEVMAAASLVGGEAALKAETEPVGTSKASADPSSPSRKQQANRDKREARKKRLKNDREELQRLRGDGPGKAKGKGKGKTESGEQLCYSWNNSNGACAGLAPGAECRGNVKRIHKCTKCLSPGHPSSQCPQKEK